MKLNLGCGGYPKPGWNNYDLISHPGVISRDLTTGLPEPDSSVSEIFTEHFMEHIELKAAVNLLQHCWRVLKPGGRIQIVMPDCRKIADMYLRNDIEGMRLIGLYEANNGSMCQFLNQAMRAWGHKFLWDVDELSHQMRLLGFLNIREVPMEERLGYRKIPTDLAVEALK